jgi:hypothetical protein
MKNKLSWLQTEKHAGDARLYRSRESLIGMEILECQHVYD